jgi:DNA-binding transcriptional regulator YiaG
MKTPVEKFKEWRKRRRVSQHIAANMLGVSVDTVRAWEQGKTQPGYFSEAAIKEVCK